jgi:hypothetical protein
MLGYSADLLVSISLVERIKMTARGIVNKERLERIGIFWLVGDRLILKVGPLSDFERNGDTLSFPQSHISYWATLHQSKHVPSDSDYNKYPRGRVVFDVRSRRFKIFADYCILEKKEILHQIIKTMRLPHRQTDALPDDDYSCERCRALISTIPEVIRASVPLPPASLRYISTVE